MIGCSIAFILVFDDDLWLCDKIYFKQFCLNKELSELNLYV